MKRIKIYNVKNVAARKGIGLFARAFIRHFPLLPVEEDGRLHDPVIRENFVERLFALFRWRAVLAEGAGLSALVAFHTRHQLQIMAHSNGHYQKMDRLIAEAEQIPLRDLYEQYGRNLMDGLRLKATPKKNAHVLKRAVGCFKARFSAVEKAEMLEAIDLYRNTRTPLIVPITLINHYVRKYDPPYLKDQYYLKPHPVELLLRYHA